MMLVTKALSHGRDELSLCVPRFSARVPLRLLEAEKILLLRLLVAKELLLVPQKSPPPRQNDPFLMYYSKVQSLYTKTEATLSLWLL